MNAPRPTQQRLALPFLGFAIACFIAVGGVDLAQAQPNAASPNVQNWALGRANAPVTLVEYGSLTCSHCAQFNNEIMPTIKRQYVETGKVRYVLRPFPTPPFDLAVAMHALTLCAGPTGYYPLVDAFFSRQQDIFTAAGGETGPKGLLFAIAEDSGGLSYQASEACLRDPARQTQVKAAFEAGTAQGVASTPTLFVNGVRVDIPAGQQHWNVSYISQAIERALRNVAPRPPQTKQQAKSGQKKAKKR